MRAILHHCASNTYYGQWPSKEAAVSGIESPAIAHNELVASAGFAAFDAAECDFLGNRDLARREFTVRPKKKNHRRCERATPVALISVVLSEAKDLIAVCNRHEILRCAQDDKSAMGVARSQP